MVVHIHKHTTVQLIMVRAIARSSQLVRPGLIWALYIEIRGRTIIFSMFIWLFCLLLYAVLRLSNLQITLALCLLLNSCTIEYLVLHEMICVHGQLITFHLIISLFYLLWTVYTHAQLLTHLHSNTPYM